MLSPSAPAPVRGERGLEVRQWLIADDTATVAAAMSHHGSFDFLNDGDRQRLRSNGLRLVRVALDDLDALEQDLGGASLNTVGWYGQMLDWREIISRSIHAGGRSIAIDGRVARFDPGRMEFVGRSWIVPMEDGLRLMFQFLPQHARTGQMSYYRLLGMDAGDRVSLPEVMIELRLEEGFAYVLTCESPLVEWSGEQTAEDREQETAVSPSHGPAVSGPTTLGQFMLMSDPGSQPDDIAHGRPVRGLLIFVPRIASSPEVDVMSILGRVRP